MKFGTLVRYTGIWGYPETFDLIYLFFFLGGGGAIHLTCFKMLCNLKKKKTLVVLHVEQN